MKVIICEMCGSTNLIKQDGVYVCQSCGTKYSVEEARKMMVEGTVDTKGTFSTNVSSELDNLYEIARRAKDTNNSENAAKYYDMVLVKDPKSWEANFYVVYYQSMSCKIGEIASAATNVTNCLQTVLTLIKQNISEYSDQHRIIEEITDRTISLGTMLFNASINHYNQFASANGTANEMANNLYLTGKMGYMLGDLIESMFDKNAFKDAIIKAWNFGIQCNADSGRVYWAANGNIKEPQQQIANSYASKIKELSPEATITNTPRNTGGCIVLLAAISLSALTLGGYIIHGLFT